MAEHILQKIYNDAINDEHWVYYDWFNSYEESVKSFKQQAIEQNWSEVELGKLIKQTRNNGISNLPQKNFEWEEFKSIKDSWHEITPVLKTIAESNRINDEQYTALMSFFRNHTNDNKVAASNRVITAFLPNFVTTVTKPDRLNNIMWEIQGLCPDFPSPINHWLQDNINFIEYCNSNIQFQHPWHSSLFAWYLYEFFEERKYLIEQKTALMKDYIDLLKANKNLILTGAPGTGKTYLAKQMAISLLFNKQHENELTADEKQILEKHFCFVQFHPSYDYTDFVEGLRAENLNGQVTFNLHNGIFKDFCKRAIEKPVRDNFDEIYNKAINDILENDIRFATPAKKKEYKVQINSNKSFVAYPLEGEGGGITMTKEMIRDYVIYNKLKDWPSYVPAIGDYIKNNYRLDIASESNKEYPFIFVIDEINRGEISKIFGELFFSLDPGYRGKNGKVKTQYANIQTGETIFDDTLGQGWFYVPDNIYIIGTMNDIDRSVESMDFAMRRRFAWKEIKAVDRISMWDGTIDKWKREAFQRMTSINQQIEKIPGLNASYHIGPAYFLPLKNYEGNFNMLWDNHLRSVLAEYLRGLPNMESELDSLQTVYNPSELN
ncbi:McrB family protein [Chitinophaga sp. Hz27]|uniref:McrB family protein n=1 Tax=Chitinophaga sp. Hz27 TaxID=3347169 RepID=UPI0035E37FBE